ncbi:hypothetical protein EIC84_15730 [Comamonas sp. A23]|nr:hypothetical protein EIC84_15730 [Comamonas sp. A23]
MQTRITDPPEPLCRGRPRRFPPRGDDIFAAGRPLLDVSLLGCACFRGSYLWPSSAFTLSCIFAARSAATPPFHAFARCTFVRRGGLRLAHHKSNKGLRQHEHL